MDMWGTYRVFLLSKWYILLVGWTHVLNTTTWSRWSWLLLFNLILRLILLKFGIMRVWSIWGSVLSILTSSVSIVFFLVNLVSIWEWHLLLRSHWLFHSLFSSDSVSISCLGIIVHNLQPCVRKFSLPKVTLTWGTVPRTSSKILSTCSELIWFWRTLAWVCSSAKRLWSLWLWPASHKLWVLHLLMICKSFICGILHGRLICGSGSRMPICVKYYKIIILRNIFT